MSDPNDNDAPSTIVAPAAGGELVLTPAQAEAAREAGGSEEVSPEFRGAAQRDADRRAMYDNLGDKFLTFVDSLADAGSLGLVHGTGEEADLRRSVNSGTALFGTIVMTAVGLEGPGPLKFLAEGGKGVGEAAAKAFVKDAAEGSRGALAIRTAGGAGEMAVISGATSAGHQFTDAVLDDKEFSGYAVMEDATLGGVLGGGFSFLGGLAGRAAKRAEVGAQGGLLDETSHDFANVSDAISSAKGGMDDALATHEARLGVLNQLAKDGQLGDYLNQVPDFMAKRTDALERAKVAQAKLEGLSFEGAIDESPAKYKQWHGALEDYQGALNDLDGLMRPSELEMAPRVKPGRPEDVLGYGQTPLEGEHVPLPTDEVRGMNDLMAKNPDLRAQYESIYGESFEPVRQNHWDAGVEGGENLGGRESATSGTKTPVQSGLGRVVDAEAITPDAGRAAGELHSRFDVSDAEAEGVAERGPGSSEPSRPWSPSAEPGKFNPGEWTDAEAGRGGREITPSAEAEAGDNLLSGEHPDLAKTQFQFHDGFFAPAAQVADNARAFSDFMERMSVDTPVERGAARTPVQRGRILAETAGPEGETRVSQTSSAPEARTPVEKAGGDQKTPVQRRGSAPPERAAGEAKQPRQGRGAADEAGRREAKRAVREYIDGWYRESKMAGPKISPGDRAAATIRRTLDDIGKVANGRDVSAGASGLGDVLNLPTPRSALGATMNDLYTMRRAAEAAAEASSDSFAKTGKVAGRTAGGRALNQLLRRMGGKFGAHHLAGILGGTLGGPVGYALGAAGMSMVSRYFGFAGKAAGISGRVYQVAIKATAALLKGNRAIIAARAAEGNRPYTYSDAGPLKDPQQRIQEIRRMAQSPSLVAKQVTKAAGDLTVVHPDLVHNMVMAAMAKIQYLASVAPEPHYDNFGRELPMAAQDQRKFFEAENAANSLESVLAAIQNGSVTRIQVDALQRAHTPAYTKIAAFMSKDPEVLAALSREQQKVAEMVLGAPLTPGADPNFVARQQVGWGQAAPPAMQHGPAQALKIPGSGGPPSAGPRNPAAAPTPSQSYSLSGRAPGN
jgi:hypothetical protein